MVAMHYVIADKDHGLKLNQRVRVELDIANSAKKRVVLPYGAVFYDLRGTAWTYTNPKPLTYVRHRVKIDHVADGMAILSDGPALGTSVVTIGAALLYGAETRGK